MIQAELLDELAAEDERAVRSRADLRRLNRLMNHAGIVKALLRRSSLRSGALTLADLGAGDGSFALRLVRKLRPSQVISAVTLVDRNARVLPEVRQGFAALGCELQVVNQDVRPWLRQAPAFSILLANLFLHHFRVGPLKELLAQIADCAEVFVACEPRRGWLAWAGSCALGAIGCSSVTRHDARISVRAGFAADELSNAWPARPGWELTEGPAGLFSHGFLACPMVERRPETEARR
jgi:hypothetical protein